MKKIILSICMAIFCLSAFSQSYKKELDKLNTYIKNMDVKAYGEIEVKDDTMYQWLGSHTTYYNAKISDIKEAQLNLTTNSVEIICIFANKLKILN